MRQFLHDFFVYIIASLGCTSRKNEGISVRKRAELFKEEYSLLPETVRVITKSGKAVAQYKAEDCTITLDLEENSYYVFELWGKLNGEENHLIALTGAIYT